MILTSLPQAQLRLLLTSNVRHLGKEFDLIEVEDKKAFDLLAARKALVYTPSVAKRFAPILSKKLFPSES